MNPIESDIDISPLLSLGLGAVLTYVSDGRTGVHGMTTGADGSGNFAVLFMGEPAGAESAAREYLVSLQRAGHAISSAHIVPNEQLFTGSAIRVVEIGIKNQRGGGGEDGRRYVGATNAAPKLVP